MTNFKTCINGHNYDESKHPICPFCPDNKQNTDYDETLKEFKKTQLINDVNSGQFDKTMIIDNQQHFKTTLNGETDASANPFNTTIIDTRYGTKDEPVLSQPTNRKIAGWIVTFSISENGQDYKLFEGENKIGSASNNDIVINHVSIAAEHATILFSENGCRVKDIASTHTIKINGTVAADEKLKDGDELTLGTILFKFKTVA